MLDPLSRAGRAPLVGREDELTLLAHALAEARAGRLWAVMLAGEPGIGKTRLLDEFPTPAQAAGAAVIRGGASRAEGMPPYLPFLEALGECVAAASDGDLRRDLGHGAAVLAPVLPAIAARLPAPLSLPPIAPDHERLRLHEAVAAFLAATAARAGALVLSLDDLHWADAATCDLLVHVARRLRRAPVLLLGAYRESEAEDNPPLGRALHELDRLRLLRRLALGRLTPRGSAALASGLLGGPVAPAVGGLLHRHAEGNPYFAEELLRALVEDGAIVRREARWDVAAEPALVLPDEVAGAVRMRLDRLPEDALEALAVAALLGRAFAPEPVAAVLQTDTAMAEDRLGPAVHARLLRPDPDGGYAFTHDKVRETLVAGIPPARRRRLHTAIGHALEAEEPRRPTDLAYHFLLAGDRTRGAACSLEAGDRALAA
ncbi:MAG TPA: AAA family ATPase, partial [Candidatus Dormibacteraeota bacterium]|nr:AAA family ATPase [Candidatus Dormibacteraeota bacterium]